MNTLIAYATKYGCVEKCASILSEKLTGEVDLYNLKEIKNIDISKYDKVIIGGSIYMGKIQKVVREFSSTKLNQLKEKEVGLFICGMGEGENAEKELKDSFPVELYAKATARGVFGGKFIFKKMNFLEKLIVKKVSKVEKDVSNISEKKINEFAELMNNVY